MKSRVKRMINNYGYEVRKIAVESRLDHSFADERIWQTVKDFTMTPQKRVLALLDAVSYVIDNKIRGDFVECGVWRGGSSMAIACRLVELNELAKTLWLYDTFEGMTSPTENDVDYLNREATDLMNSQTKEDPKSVWCLAGLDEVRRNVEISGLLMSQMRFVKGDVAMTLSTETPDEIALLRLDTDFYESTKIELEILYPKLSNGGVLIIDDYGYWRGSKKAVDEYFSKSGSKPLLVRVDDSCRIAVKV